MRTDTFDGVDGRFVVSVPRIDWPSTSSLRATGNAADGRGARGAVPFHLEIDSRNLAPGEYRIEVRVKDHVTGQALTQAANFTIEK